MKEKAKKMLLGFGCRMVVAAGLFLIMLVLKPLAGGLLRKISIVWTKEADLLRAAELFKELIDVLI